MLVMPVATVLVLQKLMPHQEMLRKKLLLPYNHMTMAGRVIFVSHQVRPAYAGLRSRFPRFHPHPAPCTILARSPSPHSPLTHTIPFPTLYTVDGP